MDWRPLASRCAYEIRTRFQIDVAIAAMILTAALAVPAARDHYFPRGSRLRRRCLAPDPATGQPDAWTVNFTTCPGRWDERRDRRHDHHGVEQRRSDARRVSPIDRCPATRPRHDRCVDEAQTEVGKAPVDFHGARELPECRRRIREGATREILHEQLHPLALVAKEVVDFG